MLLLLSQLGQSFCYFKKFLFKLVSILFNKVRNLVLRSLKGELSFFSLLFFSFASFVVYVWSSLIVIRFIKILFQNLIITPNVWLLFTLPYYCFIGLVFWRSTNKLDSRLLRIVLKLVICSYLYIVFSSFLVAIDFVKIPNSVVSDKEIEKMNPVL